MTIDTTLGLACGLAVLAMTAAASLTGCSGPKKDALDARERLMEALGKRLAQLDPKCKVLVLSNPLTQHAGYLNEKNQYERASVRGLRKGLGRHIPVTVAFPELRPEYFSDPQSIILPPDCRTPLSFVIAPGSVDQLAAAHPECRVIVSLIGLPTGVDQLKVWSEKDPRTFALLLPDLRVLGPPAAAIDAFRSGKLIAAVTQEAQSGDPLIITRENMEAVLATQPKALGY